MALTIDHIHLIYNLLTQSLIGGKKSKSILEIGQQNWFGDVDPVSLFKVAPFNDEKYQKHLAKIKTLWSERPNGYLFELAFVFYQISFEMEQYRAFDLHGTDIAEPVDLNYPVLADHQYDVVTNFGTTEHIFNQASVFETIHNFTKASGLMLHVVPNQGQYNHGFYNYHPTFFYDLASANEYEMIAFAVLERIEGSRGKTIGIVQRSKYQDLVNNNELPTHSGLTCVLRKGVDGNRFVTPTQGVYGVKRDELALDWQTSSIS